MSTEQNKELVRLYLETTYQGDPAIYDDILGPEFNVRSLRANAVAPPESARGPEAFKKLIPAVRAAFSEGHITIDEIMAEGEHVIARWTMKGRHTGDFLGLAPTEREITYSGINGFRIEDGKLADAWDLMDSLSLFQQVGVVPSTAEFLDQARTSGIPSWYGQIPDVPPDPNRKIEIVCHRGANEYAPENTFANAQICIDWHMDYVEIDVSTSRDGVLYLMHGPTVDKTTDGAGQIGEMTSAEIDRLDAGSWFDPRFAGERVPRLESFLGWIRGKAKLFLDVKSAEPQQLIDLIYRTGLENDCFFWSRSDKWALRFRSLAPNLQLKINVATAGDVVMASERFGANIVEMGLEQMNQALVNACREHSIKMMVYHKPKDPEAYREILRWGADMINLNHGDVFAEVARNMR